MTREEMEAILPRLTQAQQHRFDETTFTLLKKLEPSWPDTTLGEFLTRGDLTAEDEHRREMLVRNVMTALAGWQRISAANSRATADNCPDDGTVDLSYLYKPSRDDLDRWPVSEEATKFVTETMFPSLQERWERDRNLPAGEPNTTTTTLTDPPTTPSNLPPVTTASTTHPGQTTTVPTSSSTPPTAPSTTASTLAPVTTASTNQPGQMTTATAPASAATVSAPTTPTAASATRPPVTMAQTAPVPSSITTAQRAARDARRSESGNSGWFVENPLAAVTILLGFAALSTLVSTLARSQSTCHHPSSTFSHGRASVRMTYSEA